MKTENTIQLLSAQMVRAELDTTQNGFAKKNYIQMCQTAIDALEKQAQLKVWIEQISNLDIEYHSAELASILKDFLIE